MPKNIAIGIFVFDFDFFISDRCTFLLSSGSFLP